MKHIRVGIVGFGTVGRATADIISKHSSLIERRSGVKLSSPLSAAANQSPKPTFPTEPKPPAGWKEHAALASPSPLSPWRRPKARLELHSDALLRYPSCPCHGCLAAYGVRLRNPAGIRELQRRLGVPEQEYSCVE